MREFQTRNSSYSHKNIDYKKLKDKILAEYQLDSLDGFYFNSTSNPASDGQNQFHAWIKTAAPVGPGIIVKLYGLKNKTKKCNSCGATISYQEQKGVDVGLATAALRLYERYDVIFLSAGDGDFEDCVECITVSNNKPLYIVGFGGSISLDIQQYSKGLFEINEHYDGICDARDIKPFESVDEIDS